MSQRFNFWILFRLLPDGKLTPNVILNINGVVIGPGVAIGPGAYIGGIDFFKILGRDIAARIENNVYIITGYYGPPVTF